MADRTSCESFIRVDVADDTCLNRCMVVAGLNGCRLRKPYKRLEVAHLRDDAYLGPVYGSHPSRLCTIFAVQPPVLLSAGALTIVVNLEAGSMLLILFDDAYLVLVYGRASLEY